MCVPFMCECVAGDRIPPIVYLAAYRSELNKSIKTSASLMYNLVQFRGHIIGWPIYYS